MWLRKLFSRRKPVVDDFDPHFESLAMLTLLLERAPQMPREAFAEIIRTQFGGIDFTAWPDITEFYAFMAPGTSDGFKAMSLIAYLTLATNVSLEQIAAMLKEAFADPDARNLAEFAEAERRLSSPSVTD